MSHAPSEHSQAHSPNAAEPVRELDPVCGMKVDPARARGGSFDHAGHTYYFCNPKCRERFSAEPEKYLAAKPAAASPSVSLPRLDQPKNAAKSTVFYICPMDPEVRSNSPGACPKCGMALEPESPQAELDTGELREMSRRFALATALSVPLFVLSMGAMLWPHAFMVILSDRARGFLELALASPVCLWAGAPFFARAIASVKNRSPNMFTLIGIGVGVAYGYSLLALFAPGFFPAEMRSAHGGMALYFEASAVIVALVLLGQVLELRARARTSSAIRQLLELSPKTARRVEADGIERDVPLAELALGDRLRVRPGEQVPLDGVVLEGNSHVNEAMLTGEAAPVRKHAGDRVIGGTLNGPGAFVLRVDKVGADTLLARIVRLVSEAQRARAPIQKLVDRVAAFFVPAVVLIALAAGAAWLAFGPEPRLPHALVSVVSVLIIACPCALGLATPMSILVATGRAASAGVLFKNAEAIEALRRVDTLVLDKTGTLTEGKPKLVEIIAAPGIDETALLTIVASLEQNSEHPLAIALVAAARERKLALGKADNFVALAGKGVRGEIDSAPVVVGNLAALELAEPVPEPLAARARVLETTGKTVVFAAISGKFSGAFAITDPVKSSASEVLRALEEDGLRLVMLSGDSLAVASVVAAEVGITEVIAGVLPAEKAATLARLQREGRNVAMAGDGVNDAPALALANVGIAMGTGSDIAIESADVTLIRGDLNGILRARKLSRATAASIRQNLFFAFFYNALGIPLAAGVFYPFFGWLLDPMFAAAAMSLSSVSVISNALRLRRVQL